ncbi:MAG TPA: class I SAM-dependent methyltransferase, partial [Gaiellaceae bacterium]|nr:class I SAM-dependent methyltransferase [Gaiellaceae bacterium]
MLAREYSTSERLEARRHNVTGWLRGEEAWSEALAAIAEARPHSVLDAGCGDGLFAREIAAPLVVGVDSAPAMVERARERGLEAHEARIEDLPFADAEFDVVVCNWVLYHLPDPEAGVRELARVVRPGGRFVGIYNRDGHMEELWSRLRPEAGAGDDYGDVL